MQFTCMSALWVFLSEPTPERTMLARTLVACGLIGFSNGFVSGYIVLRRSALEIGTLSHAIFPGLVGLGLNQWVGLLGAVGAALLVGLGSLFVSRSSRIDQNTALSILYTTAFAGGLLLLPHFQEGQKLKDNWLFGSVSVMSNADLWIAFGISATALLVLTACQRPLLVLLFDPPVAASLGVPVRLMNYLLFGIVILVLVSSLQAVGCILSVGLLVTPAATVYLLTNDARALFWGGGLVGAGSCLAAVAVGFWLNWSFSSTIILILGGLFFMALLWSPRYGIIMRRKV
jgi:manganese transport system permease protein